jgi:hypothetical protein
MPQSIKTGESIRTGCPFCDKANCVHWIGWTDDGKNIFLRANAGSEPMQPGDRTHTSGAAIRVYRERAGSNQETA